MRIAVECRVDKSPRLLQAASLFDLEADSFSRVVWDVDLPLTQRPWNIGLITGPSGSGKSIIARRLFPSGDQFLWSDGLPPWPDARSILDAFPEPLSVKEITILICAVGFSSPPAWLRPYKVLSTGQQFRCDLSRLLAHGSPERVLVCDEFTSVIDRTVAKLGSSAVAKSARARNLRFVAVSCHEDIIDWLQPDWVYRPDANSFAWRFLQRRPTIDLELVRTTLKAWPLFAHHHYLSADLHRSSVCFLALAKLPGDAPKLAAFSAWLPFMGGGPPSNREHRTVVLPDFQGVGIGMAVSSTLAAAWKALGFEPRSTTTHPAFIAARKRSPLWKLTRAPALIPNFTDKCKGRKILHATTRLTAGFRYIGPPLDSVAAMKLCV